MTFRERMHQHAARELQEALSRSSGNVSKAARDLGMNRQHFHELASKLGVSTGRRPKKDYGVIDLRGLSRGHFRLVA